ncbi:MAG: hypothetical protein M1830_002321, partial [Pleopsidium flavum]
NKDNSSTLSVNGTDNSSSSHGGIKSSIDATVEKLKSRATGEQSHNDGDNSGSSGIAKLLPGRSRKKRRTREAANQDQEETIRGRSIGNRRSNDGIGDPDTFDITRENQSSLDDDGGSSLLTYDSDPESPTTTPPPLVSRQSHIGYLTSSSPLIKTSATDAAVITSQFDGGPSVSTLPQEKSTTLPISGSTLASDTNLAPRHASTFDSSQAGPATRSAQETRDVSPVRKLREAITPAVLKKGSSPNTSPDRASAPSAGNGAGLGGLFGIGDRRGSISSRRASKSTESPSPIPQPIKTGPTLDRPATAGRNLPALSMVPRTPPSASSIEAPLTTVTPPTPTDQRPGSAGSPSWKVAPAVTWSSSGVVTSPSGNMISHRRVRSDSATHQPSKLSHTMSAPLTPTIEEANAPGSHTPGTHGSPGGPGGFFSSVFSAAQNAANTLSNTIANNQTRSRSGTQTLEAEEKAEEGVSGTIPENAARPIRSTEPKRLAVDSLGTGDLSLSHLGISPETPTNISSSDISPYPTTTGLVSDKSKDASSVQRDEAEARAEDISAARAVSAAYTEKLPDDTSTPMVDDVAPGIRPRSTYEPSVTGDQTPPNGSIFEGETGAAVRRSGSVRSRVEAVARRHRGSSAATGASAIGAATGAGNAALANPAAMSSVPKLTGFAVASKKRNRDFHQLFRSVPEDDYLIEDYSCALQREIILAGRIYISEGHICFSSNILGWVTTLVISFDEVVSVEKENTAMVFPNAIAMQTLHARHTFRSLLSRESTYDLLIGIWKISHPSLKSSLNGVRLDEGGTGDKTEKVDGSGSDDGSEIGSDDADEVYDEDEEEGLGSFTEAGEGSIAGSDLGDPFAKPVSRKTSAIAVVGGVTPNSAQGSGDPKPAEKAGAAGAAASTDFPGPAMHAPTECSDQGTHYDKVIKDETVPAPLGKVYSMIFGPASGVFMTKFLLDDQKVLELQMEDDKKGLSEDVKTRTYSYIKPLNASIGPKQTKCIITETLDSIDLEKAVSITVATQTPDVPSGNVFSVKTKYCLMWAAGNSTRLLMTCTIEWTGKSWLKGPIEKGANDGQVTYASDLTKALRAGAFSRSRADTIGSKPKNKVRRRKGDGDAARKSSKATEGVAHSRTQSKEDSWGLLEPIRGFLGPVADIVKPLLTGNLALGFMALLLFITWFRSSRAPSHTAGLGFSGVPTPERIAAYEEIWRREESGLWHWLEERVAMDGLSYPAMAGGRDEAASKPRKQRERAVRGKGIESRVLDEKLSEREIDNAIEVTQERLETLKGVVERRKAQRAAMEHPTAHLSTEQEASED